MLSPRAFSLSLIASHLLRSIWWRDESRAQAIVQAELASFRSELTWSEQLLRRSNSALERCLDSYHWQTELIKFSAIVFAELLVLLVAWLLWFRRPSSVASSIQLDSESSGSESDKSPSQVPENTVDPKLLQLPAPKVVAGKAGPTRPSDLRRALL